MKREKIAVCTGISRGLGLAMAKKFKVEGFFIVGLSRSEPPEGVADDYLAVDLSDGAAVAAAVEVIRKKYGRVDVLINNAGIGSYSKWEDLSEGDLRRLWEVDFFAPVRLAGLSMDMLESSHGTVINISSVAGLLPVGCMGAYSAVKGAFWMYSETLRMEWKRRNIRVLTVCPGRIDTGFSSRAVGGMLPPETPGRCSSSPEGLARRVYRGYESGRERLIYPWWYSLAVWFARLFPGVNGSLNRKVWHLDEE